LIGKYFYINHARKEDMVNGKLINPFHKIQPLLVIDLVCKNFPTNWNIRQFNCVDEGKIPYKGNYWPVQSYDPDKPWKYGPKLHLSNDSKTGYCHGISCYGDRGHVYPFEIQQFSFGEQTVIHFAKRFPRGSHVFTDRYYSSPNLAVYLREEYDVYLTGTMMGNRKGIPWKWFTFWDQTHSDRGFYRWLYDPNHRVYAAIWKDRAVVPMISTGFGVHNCTLQRGGGGVRETKFLKKTEVKYGRYEFPAPMMAWPYNKYMGGTDT
jgi:hypothetical protein